MSFFKKLFGKKQPTNPSPDNAQTGFKGIASEESFQERYTEEVIDEAMVDGALKMIQSYFIDNKVTPRVDSPINHPVNLDQTIDDGMGLVMYSSAFKLDENYVRMFLAMALNDFMIKTYGFKLYKDSQPEYPLRGMTLKYDKNGAKLSLYPIEYATKVMQYEANFEDLNQRIKSALESMPSADDFINQFLPSDEN